MQPAGVERYLALRRSGLYDDLAAEGWLIASEAAQGHDVPYAPDGGLVLEHPRIPFVSYPYEWPFALLKRAALLQLDVHLRALDADLTLIDASAYNIQFRGPKPVFIDTLSFRPYVEGEIWAGQQQFYDQFLNPLLLMAKAGAAYHAWYRGAQEGIGTEDLARLLGPWHKASLRVLMHVTLPASMQARSRNAARSKAPTKVPRVSKAGLRNILGQLRDWIDGLTPKGGSSDWASYDRQNSYDPAEADEKKTLLREFVQRYRPATVWDMGCNSGVYSEALLEAGSSRIIGFDADHNALASAVDRATTKGLDFLPLHLDLANPSPDQGWAQVERGGLQRRADADGIVALALEHHLAIGRNVPLPRLTEWLVGLAPRGVIEFVPKSDPMIRRMLALRQDIFPDYSIDAFEASLGAVSRIAARRTISRTGRALFIYERER